MQDSGEDLWSQWLSTLLPALSEIGKRKSKRAPSATNPQFRPTKLPDGMPEYLYSSIVNKSA